MTNRTSIMTPIEQVEAFLNQNVERTLVIKGSAGTGKTYLLKSLIDQNVLPAYTGFTATTNKAANVLRDVIDKEVSTIFSRLNLIPFDDFNTGKTNLKQTQIAFIDEDLLIIDEAYMLTKDVLRYLRNAVGEETKVIFIGDGYQLPPVFYNESPVSHYDHTLELTKIHRTDSPDIQQLVLTLRNNVDSLKFDEIKSIGTDVQVVTSQDFLHLMVEAFADKETNNKILAWTNNRVIGYNNFINTLLNGKSELSVGDHITVNKPVLDKHDNSVLMQVDAATVITGIEQTTLDVSGAGKMEVLDIIVLRTVHADEVIIAKDHKKLNRIIKELAKEKNWQAYFKLKNYFNDVRLTYASTVHKSQGSTYDTVFIDVTDICKNTKKLDIAKLMYVAASRASKKVVLCRDTSNLEKEVALLDLLSIN